MMTPVQELAVTKIKNKSREQVKVGKYEVDFVVSVKGTINVAEDERYIPTGELPPLGLLTIAMRYCGVTREAMAEAIVTAANEAKEKGVTFRELVERENEWALDSLKAVSNKITYSLPSKVRNGKVTSNLDCTLVELPNL